MNLSPAHPLYGCQLRVVRANAYIREADDVIRDFEGKCEDLIVANSATNAPLNFPDVPHDLSLAVGDAIYNLRAALDYLVYELAILDSKAIQEGTQFPIEGVKAGKSAGGNPIGFDAIVGRYLKGVSQTHRDMIENLQPYKGVDWSKDLKDISNPDKHRRLTRIHTGDEIVVWVQGPHGRGKRLPNGDTVQVDAQQTILIELPDRKLHVTGTLYTIQACIADAINLFKRDFA